MSANLSSRRFTINQNSYSSFCELNKSENVKDNMEQCIKCNQDISKEDIGLQCDYCLRRKHESCFSKKSFGVETKKVVWTCSKTCKLQLPIPAKLQNVNTEKATNSDICAFIHVCFNKIRKSNTIPKEFWIFDPKDQNKIIADQNTRPVQKF